MIYIIHNLELKALIRTIVAFIFFVSYLFFRIFVDFEVSIAVASSSNTGSKMEAEAT